MIVLSIGGFHQVYREKHTRPGKCVQGEINKDLRVKTKSKERQQDINIEYATSTLREVPCKPWMGLPETTGGSTIISNAPNAGNRITGFNSSSAGFWSHLCGPF